jgi:hypothetical protein
VPGQEGHANTTLRKKREGWGTRDFSDEQAPHVHLQPQLATSKSAARDDKGECRVSGRIGYVSGYCFFSKSRRKVAGSQNLDRKFGGAEWRDLRYHCLFSESRMKFAGFSSPPEEHSLKKARTLRYSGLENALRVGRRAERRGPTPDFHFFGAALRLSRGIGNR